MKYSSLMLTFYIHRYLAQHNQLEPSVLLWFLNALIFLKYVMNYLILKCYTPEILFNTMIPYYVQLFSV